MLPGLDLVPQVLVLGFPWLGFLAGFGQFCHRLRGTVTVERAVPFACVRYDDHEVDLIVEEFV